MIKETITLPSQGYPYRMKGNTLTVTPLTTRVYKDFIVSQGEEALLNLIDACLVDSPIKAEDLVYQDELAVYFKIRAISMGSQLPTFSVCPHCSMQNNDTVDLMSLECNYLSLDEYPLMVTLPETGVKVGVGLPSTKLQKQAMAEAKKRASKFNKPTSEFYEIFLTVSILTVEGKYDLVDKYEWYCDLPLSDAIFLESAISAIQDFGIVLSRSVVCPSCNKEYLVPLQINRSFFRESPGNFRGLEIKKGTLEKGINNTDKSE